MSLLSANGIYDAFIQINYHVNWCLVHCSRSFALQIDVENEKDTESNLEKITKDYKIMKEENAGLVKKLKSRS